MSSRRKQPSPRHLVVDPFYGSRIPAPLGNEGRWYRVCGLNRAIVVLIPTMADARTRREASPSTH